MKLAMLFVYFVLLLLNSSKASYIRKGRITVNEDLSTLPGRPMSLVQSAEAERLTIWKQDAKAYAAVAKHSGGTLWPSSWLNKMASVFKRLRLMWTHCKLFEADKDYLQGGRNKTKAELISARMGGIYLGTGISLKTPEVFDIEPFTVNLIIRCMPLSKCAKCNWTAIAVGMEDYHHKTNHETGTREKAAGVMKHIGENNDLTGTDTPDPETMALLMETGSTSSGTENAAAEVAGDEITDRKLSHEENVALFERHYQNHAMGHPLRLSHSVHQAFASDYVQAFGPNPELTHPLGPSPSLALLEEHAAQERATRTLGKRTAKDTYKFEKKNCADVNLHAGDQAPVVSMQKALSGSLSKMQSLSTLETSKTSMNGMKELLRGAIDVQNKTTLMSVFRITKKMFAAANIIGTYTLGTDEDSDSVPAGGYHKPREACNCQDTERDCLNYAHICKWDEKAAAGKPKCQLRHRFLPACAPRGIPESGGQRPCESCVLGMGMATQVGALAPFVPAFVGHFSLGPGMYTKNELVSKQSMLSHCVKNCPACLLSKISSKAAELYRSMLYFIDMLQTYVVG